MKNMALVLNLILFCCNACENKRVIKGIGADVFSPRDIEQNIEDAVVYDAEDVSATEIDSVSPHDSDAAYFSCGDVGTCQLNFICINQNLCCPNSLPQECGGQCFPAECECVEDGDFAFCLPDNIEYCGNGVSCPEGECWQDGENFHCVSEDQEYCGAGVVCNLNLGEICRQDGNNFYCAPKGYIYCFEQDRWCKDSEICTEDSCCPKEKPIECGQTCCYSDEPCVDTAKSVCLPKDGEYCNGAICVAGETCAPNGMPDCVSENADICADGHQCPPGSVCSIGEKGDCCPQGLPQRCGKICCPESYDCVETDYGKKCIYPGAEPCADSWCEPDEFCADEILGVCANDGSDPCEDGHICEPGTYCAGPTCCSYINANQNCGTLCCPSNWQCISGGEACIPPGATYLGNGKYCEVGTAYNIENGNCDPVGWESCGTGSACKLGTSCVKDEGLNIKQCCPADQKELCKDTCCYTGFGCCSENICIPPGAECCWGSNVNKWCPSGKFCGKKGKNCIPVGGMECENGDFCSIAEKCTESKPECCPWATPVPCVDKCCLPYYYCAALNNGASQCCKLDSVVCVNSCCPVGYLCEELNSEKQCVSPDKEICFDTIVGDTLCDKKISFCAPDGGCIDNSYKGQAYNYCGGGETCGIEESCGGLCSGICCDGVDQNDQCELKIDECLQGYNCSETKTMVSCCKYIDGYSIAYMNNVAKVHTDCIGGVCKNLKCGPNVSSNSICCTYDKATPVGCVNGCIPDGQVCYDQPVSNSNFNNPTELGIYSNEVPNEIGSYCSNGDYVSWFVGVFSLGFVTFDIYFQPAGFDANYYDGVYHVENNGDNWISISGNPGDEILIIEWVWMIDNLEGNDCPHGPYAQLYIIIHKKGNKPENLSKPLLSSILANTVYGNQTKFLKGPFSGSDTWKFCFCFGFGWLGICFDEECVNGGFETGAEQEWVDFLKVNYTPNKAGVYKWEKDEEEIYFTLRESDGSVTVAGIDIIRWDDFMGLYPISKKQTKKPCGQTIDLSVYRNTAEDDNADNDGEVDAEGNPVYYKTNKVGARIKFRTIKCTGKPGDPC